MVAPVRSSELDCLCHHLPAASVDMAASVSISVAARPPARRRHHAGTLAAQSQRGLQTRRARVRLEGVPPIDPLSPVDGAAHVRWRGRSAGMSEARRERTHRPEQHARECWWGAAVGVDRYVRPPLLPASTATRSRCSTFASVITNINKHIEPLHIPL